MKQTLITGMTVILFFLTLPLYAEDFTNQKLTMATAGGIQTGGDYTNFSVIGDTIAIDSSYAENYSNSVGFLLTANAPYQFTITGTISFEGNATGMLLVDAVGFDKNLVGASYEWIAGDTQKIFSLSVPDGTYTIFAFMDIPDEYDEYDGKAGDCEPVGKFTEMLSHSKTDCRFTLKIPDSCDQFIKGDVNSNGILDLEDVKLTFRIFQGDQSTSRQFDAANVCHNDGGTLISISDVRGVFRLFIGGSPDCDQ